MKICIMTDIEGVAGVVSHADHSSPTGKYYADSMRLLTGEVNAAVEGLLAEGVEEVLVIDGHGPGAIQFEELHPRALLLHGRPITYRQMVEPMWEYDAVALVGQHARAGVRYGNQNHTMDSANVDWMKLNGRFIGETVIVALIAGARHIPLIFLSGDEAACEEAREDVPKIWTVAVKKGISTNVEISLSAQASREKIREGISGAIRAHLEKPVSHVRWASPYRLEIRWKSTQSADLFEHQWDGERVDDQTVAFSSAEIMDVLFYRNRCGRSDYSERNGVSQRDSSLRRLAEVDLVMR